MARGKLEKVGEQERTFEKVWGGMAQKKMSVLPFAAVVGVGDIAKPMDITDIVIPAIILVSKRKKEQQEKQAKHAALVKIVQNRD